MLRPVILCVIALQLFSSQVFAVPIDFDQDGISDTTYITSSNSSRIFRSVATSESGGAIYEVLGVTQDGPAIAHWLSGDLPLLGYVRPRTESALVWKILLGDGILDEKEFGVPGDVYIAGADFNGNGIADAAVARLTKKRIVWEIKTDLFEDAGDVQKITFGNLGDKVFFVNPDGAKDWLGTFGKRERVIRRKNGKKKTRVRTLLQLRSLTSRAVRSTRGIPVSWAEGTTKYPPPRPLPLMQPDGSDLLVFARGDASDTSIETYDIDGNLISTRALSGTGTIAIGDFLATEAGEEVALKTSQTIYVFNPVTLGSAQRSTISGDLVDEISIDLTATSPP